MAAPTTCRALGGRHWRLVTEHWTLGLGGGSVRAMDCSGLLGKLEQAEWYHSQLAAVRVVKGRKAHYGTLEPPLPESLERRLSERGIKRLFSHQVEAINSLRRGEHTAVMTSTASGKTLCYLLPILEDMEEHPNNCSLLLYPTKALAQDQLRKTRDLIAEQKVVANVYDGDTPVSRRPAIRKSSHLIYSNPDMLHMAILPNHNLWASFFANLRWVVLDEVHTYRGVFGSHTANVIRRLRRVCSMYGAEPMFACCSATVTNAQELVEGLTGLPFQVIDQDGSPSGNKHFALWDPWAEEGTARGGDLSANTEAARLLGFLMREEVRSIAFVRARVIAELILRYVREALRHEDRELAKKLMSYRAGYLPEERREIERRLFNGELLAVVATTALEVGVDIGGLEATVMVGYPFTIASTWQQAGRSGRGTEDSVAILMLYDNALERYLLKHPEFLLDSPVERTLLAAENPFILAGHLLCAAYEGPIGEGDLAFFPEGARELLPVLEEEGYLAPRPRPGGRTAWHWNGAGFPNEQINIRSASGRPYSIRLGETMQEIGSVDGDRAFYHVHPGAIYLHQGESFLVEDLDLAARVAKVRRTRAEYYTQPVSDSDVRLREVWEERKIGGAEARLGEAFVTERVVGYRRRRVFTGEIMEEHPLDLPPNEFNTIAFWLTFPPGFAKGLPVTDFLGALHAMEHASIAVLPLFAACDRLDLGGFSHLQHPDTGVPTLAIYDSYPGGVGIAKRGYEVLEELLRTTREAIGNCPCESGCPACVQSPSCGDNNEPMDKAGSLAVLEAVVSGAGPQVRRS